MSLFDWDQWNRQKNEGKHGVSATEAESAFADPYLAFFRDDAHSTPDEARFLIYGESIERRVLMIGFTMRQNKIRIITARAASRKERKIYDDKRSQT